LLARNGDISFLAEASVNLRFAAPKRLLADFPTGRGSEFAISDIKSLKSRQK